MWRRLNLHFNGRVDVLTKEEALQAVGFNKSSVAEHLTILVLSYASLRARNKDDRKVNDNNSYLQSFETVLPDADEISLMDVVRHYRPVVVVDESHNAESELSTEMLKNLNPSFILDLTATPRKNSNIISFVDALELRKNNMVKLPVIVSNHRHKNEVILSVINLQKKLEKQALEEHAKGGKYIRPIVLFQAQSKNEADATTFTKIKEELVKDHKIPAEQIKIKTAVVDELKNVDLMADTCPVRFIITINALKEGWDCPFAYVLASLANRSSAVDVEQIVGRILRQPYVVSHKTQMLNMSYVFTASEKFMETLQSVVKGLNNAGFSERDCRLVEAVEVTTPTSINPQIKIDFTAPLLLMDSAITNDGVTSTNDGVTSDANNRATSTNDGVTSDANDEVTSDANDGVTSSHPVIESVESVESVESFESVEPNNAAEETPSVSIEDWAQQAEANIVNIERIALEQSNIMERKAADTAFSLPSELTAQVKFYHVKPIFEATIADLQLPQFFIKVPTLGLGLTDNHVFLAKENLLEGFSLDKCDTDIDFENVAVQLFQIDLDETTPEHTPAIKELSDVQQKLIYQYLLDPTRKNERLKNFSDRIRGQLDRDKTVQSQDLLQYIRRILRGFTDTQFEHLAEHEAGYVRMIKEKIDTLKTKYSRDRFEKLLKTNEIVVKGQHKLPSKLILTQTAKSIDKTLYEKEGSLNGFEERVIFKIANAENVLFWTRNIEMKGFKLNGFVNHYPDFIVYTRSGKILLIETKGDDRDNSDSEQKLELGEYWENKAGEAFKYFMVFDKKQLKGAYTLDKFMEILKQM